MHSLGTKGFLIYLLTCSAIAVLSVLYFGGSDKTSSHVVLASRTPLSDSGRVWPELELSWRVVLATAIAFMGSAFGTVGGVGAGGIFVPMLNLILGFDTKSSAALSKCLIMGAAASSVWYNLRVPHPTKEVPILDYNLALLFQPMLLLGITIGVSLSVVFPYWLITILIIVLFIGTSSRSFFKGLKMWNQETLLMIERERQRQAIADSSGQFPIVAEYQLLVPKEERTTLVGLNVWFVEQTLCFNLRWKKLLLLFLVWGSYLLIQLTKQVLPVCGTWYWVLFCSQFPISLAVFGFEASRLYKDHKKRIGTGNTEGISEATINWTPLNLCFCGFCGVVGGTVGGLLGSGGGFILGPLLLEIGVIPQVASATATFVMMFSSSLSVVEFYLLNWFPVPYALYLIAVSVMAGFWGQFFLRKLIKFMGRASVIVFVLSVVIFLSALVMGIAGVGRTIHMIQNHEFMGFLGFCISQ